MMSLLEKASIITTPTAYDDGKLLSVKPVGGENLLLQSNQFDTTWVTNCNLTSGQLGYDGTNDAWLLEKDATGFRNLYQDISTLTGVGTLSIYAKANSNSNIIIRCIGGTDAQGFFDLSNGTLAATSVNCIDAQINAVGNGWYRCSIVFNTSGTTSVNLYPDYPFGGTSAGNIYIQDAQLERGKKANTYIETTTTAIKNGDFSFTRGSSATRVNEQGLVSDVQILSGELVQNGDFEEIGSEEVSNGDFEQIGSELVNSSNWINSTIGTATITNGVITFVNGTGFLRQGIISANTFYKFSIELSNVSQGQLFITTQGGVNSETLSTNGVHEFYLKSTSAGDLFVFAQSNFTGSIDNVSVKQVDPNDYWILGGDAWSITDKLSADGTQTTGTNSYQSQTFDSGKTYKVVFTCTIQAGNLDVRLQGGGSTVLGTTHTTSGTYTQLLTSTGNTSLRFRGNEDFIGSIDNVSVKEVGQNWEFNAGWSMGDGVAIGNASIGQGSIYQQSVFEIGKKYQLKLDATLTSGSFKLEGSGGSTLATFDETKSYDVIIEATQVDLMFRRITSSFIGTIDNISVQEVTDDTDLPRINYTNFDYENGEVVPYSGEGSLLLEPQSTNLVTYSEDFSNSYWTKGTNTTVINNYAISPEGKQNATRIQMPDTSGTFLDVNLSGLQGNTLTVSFYAKNNGGATNITTFSPDNNSQTISLTDKWVRYDFTSIAASNVRVGIDNLNGGGAVDFLLYAFQLEELSYATSYIPTEGSTKTRLQDICNNAGSSDLINSTEGVLYFEGSALANDGTTRYIAVSDGSNNERVQIIYLSNNSIASSVVSLNSSQCSFNYSGGLATDFNKIAISYKDNDFKMYVNGTQVDSHTIGNAPSGLNTLGFERPTGVSQFHGNVKCVAVFKEALSDSELACLTS